MPVRFDCPSCKANYEVADDLAGKMIMCKVCKKRGAVRKAETPAASAAAGAAGVSAVVPSASKSIRKFELTPSRRSFLKIGGFALASVASITIGAVLARKPWRHWNEPEPDPNADPFGRGRGGPGRGKGNRGGPPDKGPPPV